MHTYDDWISCKIQLSTSVHFFQADVEEMNALKKLANKKLNQKKVNPSSKKDTSKKKPTEVIIQKLDTTKKVNYNQFSKKDAEKIKQEQERIFKTQVLELLEKVKTHFISSFNKSALKEVLLEREINEVKNLLLSPKIPLQTFKLAVHWNLSFTDDYYNQIVKFIDDYIINGRVMNYDFVNSPNQKQTVLYIPQVYAQFLWKYNEWLEEFSTNKLLDINDTYPSSNIESKNEEINSNSINIKTKEEVEIVDALKMESPHYYIFKNIFAYKFFLELKDLFIDEKKPKAGYGFILRMMKADGFYAIKKEVYHKDFINYLIAKFDFPNYNNFEKFNSRTPINKMRQYKLILNKYLNLINETEIYNTDGISQILFNTKKIKSI